jgi:hypothetical protein
MSHATYMMKAQIVRVVNPAGVDAILTNVSPSVGDAASLWAIR